MDTIRKAIEAAGGAVTVQKACGLKSYQAVMKWVKAGRLPKTEHTGETDYSSVIAKLCRRNGHKKFTKTCLKKAEIGRAHV